MFISLFRADVIVVNRRGADVRSAHRLLVEVNRPLMLADTIVPVHVTTVFKATLFPVNLEKKLYITSCLIFIQAKHHLLYT